MKGELASYLAILETEPDNERALAALEALAPKVKEGNGVSVEAAARALGNARRVHRERNDWDLVARLLDLELAWTNEPGRRADLLYEKGRVLSDELLRDEEAVACFQKVLEVRPDDGAAQEVLGHLSIMRDNWEPIAAKYLGDAKGAGDKQLATSLYLSAAELYIKNSPDAAEGDAYLRKALELDPRNRKAAAHLERRLRAQGKWDELQALLTKRSESAGTKEERAAAMVALAELSERQGDKGKTLEAWRRVLTMDAANNRALRALVEVLTEGGDWAGLVKIYEAALKARPRGEQEGALILQIGMLHWKKLQDLESAEPFFRRVRKAEPSHPMALEFYRAFFTARGEGQKLLVVLQAAAKVETDPARRLQLAIEMARGAEGEAGAEKAIDLWKAVLRMEGAGADTAAQYQSEAAEALRRLYRKTEKWNALLELLKDEIEALAAEKKPEKIAIHLEVADIYREKLGLDAMVIGSYQNILAIDPGHERALEQLAARYEALGRWNDLISVLIRRADAVAEKTARVALLRRVASLWLDKFANANQAVRPLEEILGLEPEDAQTIASLRDIYARRRSWKQLLDLDRRELLRLSGSDKKARLAQMARLAAERLGDARESINLWNQVLALEEHDAEALTSLVSLYEREKRWASLVEVLRRQALAATENAQKVALLERVGLLFVERLGAPTRAAQFYREILILSPGHQKAQRTLRELYAQQGDFAELERLYAETGQWEELAETLLAFVDRAQDTQARLQLLGRIATIYIEKLGKPDRAVKSYERILALDPGNLGAARSLVPIYRQGEKWARLLETYKILLGHAKETAEKLELLREIRQLCEQRLGSKGLAFEWCAKAYELAPTDAQVGTELERLAEEAGAWEDLSQLYARRAEGLADAAAQIAIFRRLAKIAKEKTGRTTDARKYWEEVLARDGHDGEALAALEQIFTQQSAWPELSGIYRRRAEAERDGARRLELELRVAFLEEERLADLPASAQSYRKALATARESNAPKEQARILGALERIHTALSQWPEVISIIEEKLGAAESNEAKAGLYVQQGGIYEQQLADRGRALGAYKQAVAMAGGARGAAAALERFLEDRELSVEAAALLAPIHERENEPEKHVRDLEILLAAEADAEQKLGISRRLSVIYGKKLANPGKAYEHGARVLEKHYHDPEVRRIMAQLAEALERWDDYAMRLERAATDTEIEGVRNELHAEIAEIYDSQLNNPAKAAEFYAKVSGAAEQTERSFIALARIYRQEEKWPELRKLLDQRQRSLLDPPKRMELLFQICDLNEGVLDDQDDATRVYRQILELDAGNARSFKALERVLTAQEKWTDLDELLQQEMAFAAGAEEAASMRFKRAELHATKLSDLSGAVDLLEEVLAQAPQHEGARKVLERLMGRAELRQRVAAVLEPYYEKDEAWPKLVAVLQVRREPLEGHAALDMLAHIADLQEEKLNARQAAFLTWRESLRLDPADARARDNVSRLGTLLERWNELAQAWEEGFALAAKNDHTLRADYLERAAKLYEDKLADPARAQGAWRRLLDLDPQNASTAQPAAAALAALYEKAGAWTDLVGILRQQSEWADDSGARKGLLLGIARIHENNLGSAEAAIATYREVLEAEPEEPAALDALERLYSGGASWRDQIGILKRRVDLSRKPPERRNLYWRIAEIQERELGAAAEAIESYNAILDELPDDVPALRAIGRLYEQAGRFSDLREILIRELALTEDPGAKLALMHRLAALAEEKLARLDVALERWQEILALGAPDEKAIAGIERALADENLKLKAAEILEPIWQQRGDLQKQIQLHELLAEAQSDPGARTERLRAAAELKERTGDTDGAFDTYARAARGGQGGVDLGDLLEALERLAGDRRRQDDLVALYREIGADVLDAQLQQRIYLVIADLARTKDTATARDYYRRIVEAAPDHPRALAALEALYLESQEWEPLFEIYQKRADLAQDPDQKKDYLARAAVLTEDKLGHASEAISFHEQILEIAVGDRDAMNALERLYGDAQRVADLADLLERRLGFADDLEEAVRLRYRLGELYDKQLKDPDRAVENYRATLGGEPGHAGAIAALERFLEDPAQQAAAAEVLEPVYAARQDWPKLVRIYEIRLMAAEEAKLRLQLLRRIARLYEEQLEDLDHAFLWYGKVFREAPEDRGARDQMVRLAGVLEKWKELAEIYQGYLDDTMEPGPAWTAVCWTLAGLYDERLGEVDRAKDCYTRLLEQSPGDRGVLEALERSLIRAERWRDILDLYEDTVAKEPDAAARKELLGKIARVQEKELGDADEASAAWRRVLEQDPEDRAAIDALDRLLTAGQKWHDLVELLVSQLDRAPATAWIAIKHRLGTIFEQNLEDPNAAIDVYEECLGRDPTHKESLAALERLVVDKDHRFRIAQILEPIYKQANEWAKLVVIYDAQLEFIEDATRRVDVLREMARLHEEHSKNPKHAWEALARAFKEDPGREDSLAELERITAKMDRFGDLVGVLEKAAEGVYDPEVARGLHARAAEHYAQRLGNAAAAITAWRRVLEAKDDDQNALAALEKLLDQTQRWEELVEVLERRSDLADDATLRKTLLYRASEIEEHNLAKPERAAELWHRVLGLDDADEAALDSLERLHGAAEQWRELTEIVARKIELALEPRARRALLFKQADIWERRIEDRYEAIGSYKAAREIDPNDAEALAALDRLYEAEKMWADLLEILEVRIQLEANPAAREELRFRSAVVTEEESGDVDGAIERYRKVLDAVPEHKGARERLFALVRAEGTRDPAAAALEPYLRARKEWPKLIEIIDLRIEAESDAARRRQLLAELAQLHEQGRQDLQAAFAAWGRALGEDAGDTEAQRELERIAAARGGFADLAALYEDRLANQYDAEIGRQIALKLATIYEDALGDAASAVDKLRQALDYPGDERGPLGALDRLLENLGRWQELAEILEREAQAGLEPAEQAGYLYRLGLMRLERLQDHDGAIEAWRDVLERDPQHDGAIEGIARYLDDATYREQAIEILEPAYEARADHKNLVRALEVKLLVTEEPLERARLLERIAELAEKELASSAAALDAWARALAEDPGELRYADEAARLGDALGMPGEAAGRIEAVADAAEAKSREAARDLGLRAGGIWLGKARDLARAEARYRRVLALDTENTDALEALDQIARAKGDDRSLCDMLSRRAALELDARRKRELLAEAAAIAEQRLRDPKAAIEAWKAVVEGDDTDAAAQGELARLYEAAGEWAEHAQALERRGRVTDDPAEQAALYARAGAVWMGRLGDAEHAAEAYRSALDAKHGDVEVLRALEDVHTRREDWLGVQEVLTQQLAAASGPGEQVAIYAKLARLSEEKNQSVDEATGFWTQALDADPQNEKVFAELERLLQAGEKWYELADVLQKHADLCAQRGDGGGELAKLLMIADVWERRIGNSDSAAEILEKVLERDPRNVSAMTQLARIYESAGEWDKCAQTLERAAALGPQGGAAAELYYRMGKVEVERGGGDEAKAETHWARALQFDAGHHEALEGLERIARGHSDWRRVVQLLDLRERAEPEAGKKRDLLAEIGKLLRTELGAPQEALAYLERAVQLAPDDARVAEPLADAYFAAGRIAEAGKLYVGLLDRLKGKKSKEVARLTFRLGAIAEKQGQAAQATEYFNHAFTIDPTHGPTMAALGRLYSSQQDWEKARKIYRSMLLQNLDAETGMSKADVYLELGRIHSRLGEAPKARNMFERGLEAEPDHKGLKEALAQLR